MRIVRSLVGSKKFNYGQISDFLHFMDQLIPLRDQELKRIFEQEITTLLGGNNTMGIMEAVREHILDEGIEKGRHLERVKALEEKRTIARNLKNKGIDLGIIAEATGLSIKELEAL